MAMKHNITGMLTTNSSLWDITNGVNVASNNILAYMILMMIFIISAYFIMKKTSDIGKSYLMGLAITTVTSLMLYYAGETYGTPFIPDLLMLGLMVLLSLSVATITFMRQNKNENR